jgi:hypothetical protein
VSHYEHASEHRHARGWHRRKQDEAPSRKISLEVSVAIALVTVGVLIAIFAGAIAR